MEMFCYQCEQATRGTGCTTVGVCGKDAETAALHDLLVHATQGMAMYARRARALGARDDALDAAMIEALYTTITNVNFDAQKIAARLRGMAAHRDYARALYEDTCHAQGRTPEKIGHPANFVPAADHVGLLLQAEAVSITARRKRYGEDVAGLMDLLVYGLKGMAAYADHARVLGKTDDGVCDFFYEALDHLASGACTLDGLLALCLRCGEANLRTLELLDEAHTGAYGHPAPTKVRTTPRKGKAILVSGHDLRDLHDLLVQTEGRGIDVYTHGELLPAHGYPGLRRFSHLAGNFGGSWQDQVRELVAFPGAILFTTNCIQRPVGAYRGRLFTTGLVEWPGVTHVKNGDFGPVISAALSAPGFAADEPEKSITVGFGHEAVLNVAGAVVAAVQAGRIRRFFLIGGCDGAKTGRNYYTELAQAVPKDCVILTLACGKYRFNKMAFGEIDGIPRLLDVGQCNDAYSAVKIAQTLAQAFETDIHSLPLSIVLSWYEQKAVVVLLTLLHLGIKNIRLGPTLPAFITPPALNFLSDTFGLKPITTAQKDLKAILG